MLLKSDWLSLKSEILQQFSHNCMLIMELNYI